MGVAHLEGKAACRYGLDFRSGIWKTVQRRVGRLLCLDAPSTSSTTPSASCSLLEKQTDEDGYIARHVQQIYSNSHTSVTSVKLANHAQNLVSMHASRRTAAELFANLFAVRY